MIQLFPSSLLDFGKLHLSNTKSNLLKCFEEPEQPKLPLNYVCRELDGAVIVHVLLTAEDNTFCAYICRQSLFHIGVYMQLEQTTRVDIVWDTYLPDSLKESTQEKRGKGVHR